MAFAGQVALITGGAQGIGFGIAEHLATQGAHVVLLDMNDAALQSAVALLAGKGLSASCSVLNVSSEVDWERVVAGILDAHKRIDILVQAAGVTGKTGIKTHEVDPANWDFVFSVNAKGIFLGARAVLPAMVAAKYGRIVNIASVAGKEGNAGMAAYSSSKAAVIGLTKCIGKEYAEIGGAWSEGPCSSPPVDGVLGAPQTLSRHAMLQISRAMQSPLRWSGPPWSTRCQPSRCVCPVQPGGGLPAC